jgi:hypothetical protein
MKNMRHQDAIRPSPRAMRKPPSIAVLALCMAFLPVSACSGAATGSQQPDSPTTSSPAPTAPPLAGDWNLVANLGVNTHLEWLDSSYANVDKAKAALAYLGIHRLRDVSPSWYLTSFNAVADAGQCFDFFVRADAAASLEGVMATLATFNTRVPGAICAIEGLNEANLWPASAQGLTGLAGAAAVQARLYQLAKADAALNRLPVYNLSLGGAGPNDYAQLGDLSAHADLGNVHAYFYHGRPPVADMAFAINLAHTATPALVDNVMTETGYSTASKDSRAVDEPTQAKYILTLIAEAARLNMKSTYVYQLVDPFADATGTDLEMGFGLYRSDWTPKPAADAIHFLTGSLANMKRVDSATAATFYTIRASDPQTQSLLFVDAAQNIKILLWRNIDIWNEATMRSIVTAPADATVQVSVTSLTMLDLLDGKRTTLHPSPAGTFSVPVPDHPIILDVTK